MLPACRTDSDRFTIPTFDVVSSDVEGFMDELWEFQAAFHDCFTRSESRAHFFDYMVGQLSQLERKSIGLSPHVEHHTLYEESEEYMSIIWPFTEISGVVNHIYRQILERDADPSGLLSSGSLLQRGEASIREIMTNIGLSEEYIVAGAKFGRAMTTLVESQSVKTPMTVSWTSHS